MPVAHADGRYHIDAEGLEKLAENEQILLKYCDENGELTEEANFNDSVDSLAGVCNEKRNVFGMMPHPERAAESILGNEDGKTLLTAFLNHHVAV